MNYIEPKEELLAQLHEQLRLIDEGWQRAREPVTRRILDVLNHRTPVWRVPAYDMNGRCFFCGGQHGGLQCPTVAPRAAAKTSGDSNG